AHVGRDSSSCRSWRSQIIGANWRRGHAVGRSRDPTVRCLVRDNATLSSACVSRSTRAMLHLQDPVPSATLPVLSWAAAPSHLRILTGPTASSSCLSSSAGRVGFTNR
ncbi:hypothetical protein L9F63_021243, partial [Diploptera punctata]